MMGAKPPPTLATVEQIPIAVFLMEVGYNSAVYMKVTLKAAETQN